MAETEEATKQEGQTDSPQEGQTDSPEESSEKTAQSAELSEATDGGGTSSAASVEILLDMSLPVTVSLGRTKIPVRRLLQLSPGSVLQLDKSIDAPVDLFVRDTKFATGDVVVVDGQFGVRVKEVCGGAETEAGGQKSEESPNDK